MYGSESQLKHLMLSIHVWKLQSWRHWCKETSVICIFGGQCFTFIIIVECVLLKAPEEMFSGLQYWLMCSVAGTEASNYSSYRAILLKLSTGQNWRKYAFYSGISEVLFLSSSSQDLVVEQTVLLVFLLLSSCSTLLPYRSCLFSSHNVLWGRIMLRYCSSFRSFTLQCIVSKPLAAVPALLVVCTHPWDLGSSF